MIYAGFQKFLDAPNHYMLDTGVDGLKNYFNPMFYLKYDSGTHFSGMNYPYGEHLVFTDGQPLITWILKGGERMGLEVADHLPGIFNLLMFASIWLGMLLLFGIGRFFQLPSWYAMCVGIIIGALAPQLHRLAGHYALAYACILPACWLMLLHLFSPSVKHRWKNVVGLLLLGIAASMIHVYYVMITGVFILSYHLIASLPYWRKDWKRVGGTLMQGLLLAGIPVLIFKAMLSFTDTVIDRPTHPYGFFDHLAYWEGVFFPEMGPIWDFWNYFADIKRVVNEGYAYVGLAGLLVAVFTLFRWGRWISQRRPYRIFSPALPGQLNKSFWAGCLVLLFAMGIPFVWSLEFLLDVLGPLKQFRSLGRFAWVFYYTFSMYSAVYFFLVFRRIKMGSRAIMAFWTLGLVLLFWWGEAWIHMSHRRERILQWEHTNWLREARVDYPSWLEEAGQDEDDFQAILPVPAFFIGSEKLYTERVDYFSTRHAMLAAYQTGLPIASGLLSRTSLSQSLRLAQLLSNDYLEKEILQEFPNRKPLLVIGVDDAPLTENEAGLIKKGIKLGTRDNISLYRLPLEALASKGPALAREWQMIRDSLAPTAGTWYQSDTTWMLWEDWQETAHEGFAGKTLDKEQGPLEVYRGAIPDTGVYELSLWVEANLGHDGFPVVFLKELGDEGQTLNLWEVNPKFQTDIYRNYVMGRIAFDVSRPGNTFVAYVEGYDIRLASLLIRKKNTDCYYQMPSGKGFIYNNYYFESD